MSVKDLSERFENYALRHHILKENTRILIGLSGGADSMAMLHLFLSLKKKYSLFLTAAHINYHLRDEESDADERFVKDFCFTHNIPIYVLNATTLPKQNLQKNARDIRLDYFRKLQKNYKMDYIALAHHRDDQCETILHRFIRGAGFKGLGGIKPINDGVIHPMLAFTKAEILVYLNQNNITYRTDKTNLTSDYTRNKIRNELLPSLKNDFNPNIEQKLIDYSTLFALSDDYFTQLAKKEFKKIAPPLPPPTLTGGANKTAPALTGGANKTAPPTTTEWGGGGGGHSQITLSTHLLRKIHHILRFYIYREAWATLTGTDKNFYTIHFEDISKIVDSETGYKELILPENIKVIKDYDTLIFRKMDRYIEHTKELTKEITTPKGSYTFNEYRFTLQVKKVLDTDITNTKHRTPNTEITLDLDKISFPITLRYRKDGDKFIPLGMQNYKKIKDFFIDEKVPKLIRDNIVIWTDNEKIIWLSGMRIDQRVAISPETKNYLQIKTERIDEQKSRSLNRKSK